MLTTKQRQATDVPTPADGHVTLFVDNGVVKAKQSDGAVAEVSSNAAWSPIINTAGSHTLLPGALVTNRFECDATAGIVLVMPNSPTDGMIVNIKEITGDPNHSVQVSSGGSGSVEDLDGGFSQPSTIDEPVGISISYQYDLEGTVWRIVRHYQPDVTPA